MGRRGIGRDCLRHRYCRKVRTMSIGQKSKAKPIKLTKSCNGMLMTPAEFDAVIDYDDRFVYETIH
jgi:hypothetical protein